MNGSHLKKLGIFAGGVLFGTAGLKVLGSKDAKKLYVNCLAAGLRARDCAMKTAESLQADAEDILAEAEEINRARAAAETEEYDSGCQDSDCGEEASRS